MARDFVQSVGESGAAVGVLDEGDGFHEVGDGDDIVRDGEIDRCGGGAVSGLFAQERCTRSLVFESVDDDSLDQRRHNPPVDHA